MPLIAVSALDAGPGSGGLARWAPACQLFSDAGAQSVLPQLVGRDGLVPADAAVVSLVAAGSVAGRGAGGALVHLLTAPVAAACPAAPPSP
ncbi:hypothetical protein ACFVU3_21645 [Streptomyces sp. NPDC058052]|uniref:hypothetical protein n=1 Tax=Streptomyces sp. NPDC058052 TaxID=3346316 RepID=UPI0036E88BEC